jgi:ribosomal protein S18 acetylase RimI-like enzyme
MRAAFAEYSGALPVESGAHAETLEDVRAAIGEGGAILAFDGDQAVGSARFRPDGDDLYVARVSVVPAWRRRGVASAMMRFLEGVAAAYGKQAIRIGVRDSLPSNVGLYQSLGYELVSINPHPRGPDKVWTMRKWVPPPPAST